MPPTRALPIEQQGGQTDRFGIFQAQDLANAAADNQPVKPLTLDHHYPATTRTGGHRMTGGRSAVLG